MEQFASPRASRAGARAGVPARTPEEFWKVFRSLVEARVHFGVSSQALATLRALVSFLREGEGQVVYASNRTISSRAEGLSERTIRRHVGSLVAAGLVQRNDSANGKRFRINCPDGPAEAFGIDLSPLVKRAGEIAEAAASLARERQRITFYRKRLSRLIYDLGCAAGQLEEAEAYRPALRRKLSSTQLEQLCNELTARLAEHQQVSEKPEIPPLPSSFTSPVLSANDSQSVRHKINSEHEIPDSEETREDGSESHDASGLLRKIQRACPNSMAYASAPPSSWAALESHAWTLAGWCGIGQDLIAGAVKRRGREQTALTVLLVAERLEKIRNLPAYFNSVTVGKKAADFNPVKLLEAAAP